MMRADSDVTHKHTNDATLDLHPQVQNGVFALTLHVFVLLLSCWPQTQPKLLYIHPLSYYNIK